MTCCIVVASAKANEPEHKFQVKDEHKGHSLRVITDPSEPRPYCLEQTTRMHVPDCPRPSWRRMQTNFQHGTLPASRPRRPKTGLRLWRNASSKAIRKQTHKTSQKHQAESESVVEQIQSGSQLVGMAYKILSYHVML